MKKAIISAILLLCVFPANAQQLSLDECLKMARANSPMVKNASIDVQSAIEQRKEARWEYLPNVKASALSFHALNPLVSIGVMDIIGYSDAAWDIKNSIDQYAGQTGINTRYDALQYGYGATITAIQPVFAGGRIANGNALAELGVEAASLQHQVKLKESDATIEQKYWQIVSLQEKRTTLEQALSTLEKLKGDLQAAVSSGLMRSSDIQELNAQISSLKADRVRLKSGCMLAKMDLLNLIGYEYSMLGLDSLYFCDSALDLNEPSVYYLPEEEVAARMQETRLLDLQVQAKSLEKKMTLGENLPSVGIGGAYSYGRFVGDPSPNGMVFLSVSVPLSDWGKNSHKIKRSENEILKAENQRDYLQAQLLLKARQMWVALEAAWEQVLVSEEALNIAKEEQERADAGLKAGMLTLGEYLRADLALRQALDKLTDDRMAYRQALDDYLR